uniref:Uncharacterized protein n=1 Tax=Cucumis melo TaxID=3656 RepID=A0A9I9EKC1_CUCME
MNVSKATVNVEASLSIAFFQFALERRSTRFFRVNLSYIERQLLLLTSTEEMRSILLPIRDIGFFASRGGSSTHKETELNHIHSVSIRFWFDCGSVCGSVKENGREISLRFFGVIDAAVMESVL